MRDNWWHLVAFTPLGFVLGGIIGGYVGGLIVLASILPYPFAIHWDAKYVNEQTADSGLNVWISTLLGVLVVVTIGLLSFVVTPYYVYRRRTVLTEPAVE